MTLALLTSLALTADISVPADAPDLAGALLVAASNPGPDRVLLEPGSYLLPTTLTRPGHGADPWYGCRPGAAARLADGPAMLAAWIKASA